MSHSTLQVLSDNVKLLKASASKHAIYGVMIAVIAIVIATCMVSFVEHGEVTLDGIIKAQKTNVALWLLNLSPFGFAFWGQYVSNVMAFQAGAMVVDQTNELRAQAQAIERRATYEVTHDRLTNLPNRVLLQDRLDQAVHLAHRDHLNMAVMVMDLDRFKEVNDALGRDQGDRLLRQVAARLKAAVQETETIARSGGDEFVVLLPKIAGEQDAIHTAVNISNALKAAFDLGQSKLDVQASIGIALFPEHGSSAEDLLQRAEVAMYSAKQEKSGYTIYEDKQEKNSPRRVTLVGELRQALERDELLLQYQPKIEVKSNHVTEVEVLSRWRHPRHGVIPPEEFIPLAERTGLIKIVTAWVLKTALHQLGEWSRAGIELGVSVNISTQDLHDQELYDRVTGLLAANRLDASQLVLEMTETSIMIDQERAKGMLERLASSGIRISIDDFGTGYSSLAHLSLLPVKEIKIDKSFVIDMKENPKHANIVHAIIDLGHNLDMKVVGEGVQSEHAYRELQRLGCDTLQGDYLSKPLVADALTEWVLDTSRAQKVQSI